MISSKANSCQFFFEEFILCKRNYLKLRVKQILSTIAFAANKQIPLTSALQWVNKQADVYLGQRPGYRQTSIADQSGTGFQLKSDDILNIISTMNCSGGNGASLRFSYSHKF